MISSLIGNLDGSPVATDLHAAELNAINHAETVFNAAASNLNSCLQWDLTPVPGLRPAEKVFTFMKLHGPIHLEASMPLPVGTRTLGHQEKESRKVSRPLNQQILLQSSRFRRRFGPKAPRFYFSKVFYCSKLK